MGVKELQPEVARKVHALYSLLVFTRQMDRAKRNELANLLTAIDAAPAMQLRIWRNKLNHNLTQLTKEVGCKLGVSVLAEYFPLLSQPTRVLRLHKWKLDIMFVKFANVWGNWKSVPPHALVEFNPSDVHFELYIPEAALYEDMCFAYNNAVLTDQAEHVRSLNKPELKARAFYKRSALLAAFYFVEAYLNGLGFDYLVRHKRSLMTHQTDVLSWPEEKKLKVGLVGFERKIKEYPEAILGLNQSPLTEENCAELKFLLNQARDLRDAIVHQSPELNRETFDADKLKPMLALELSEVTRVVDSSVGFVRRLNGILGAHGQDLWWLFDRDATGSFPQEAFQ